VSCIAAFNLGTVSNPVNDALQKKDLSRLAKRRSWTERCSTSIDLRHTEPDHRGRRASRVVVGVIRNRLSFVAAQGGQGEQPRERREEEKLCVVSMCGVQVVLTVDEPTNQPIRLTADAKLHCSPPSPPTSPTAAIIGRSQLLLHAHVRRSSSAQLACLLRDRLCQNPFKRQPLARFTAFSLQQAVVNP